MSTGFRLINRGSASTVAACVALALGTLQPQLAAADLSRTSEFNIAPQPLRDALLQYSQQSGVQVTSPDAIIEPKSSPGVSGELDARKALEILLNGTELVYEVIGENTVTIRSLPQRAQAISATATTTNTTASTIRLVQAEEQANSAGETPTDASASRNESSGQYSEANEPIVLQEIVVTGSHIRGIEQKFSPVISATREQLERSGYARVSEFIARLPQNFGGGSTATPDRGVGTVAGVGASTVNLRGMGADASLTLLNGRRLAPSGTEGNYVDISGIPMAALERVDVLTDGASAIYGSDAVAGVVNFILRRDYNGAETRMRLGTKTEGDANQYQVGQTFGVSNQRGRALLSYEYSSEEQLDASDRSYTAMLDEPYDILPSGNTQSAFFSGALTLGSVELFADLNYSDRRSRQRAAYGGSMKRTIADVRATGATMGLTAPISGGWRAELSGSISDNDFRNIEYAYAWSPGYGGTDMWNETYVRSIDSKVDGTLFDIGGGAVRAVFGAQYREESHDSGMDDFDEQGVLQNQAQLLADVDRSLIAAFAEIYAPLVSASNALPGARSIALSLAGRYEEYSDFGSTFNPKVGLIWSPLEGLTLRGSYGTSFRAPRLSYLLDSISSVNIVDYIDPEAPGGMSVAALVGGDSSNLNAEESKTWSVGVDLQPAFAPNFAARITYYDIEYSGRIDTPSPQIDTDTFYFHNYPLPVDRNVNLALLQSWIDRSAFPLFNYTTFFDNGSQSQLEDVTVILRGFPTNTSVSRTSGVDADVSYDFSLNESSLSATLSGNYILESEDQFSPLRAPVKKFDRIFNPARLRLRGGLMWARESFSANLFANYISSYDDDRVMNAPPRRVDSWLTLDASMQYDFDRVNSESLLAGTMVTLSVINMLNEKPPKTAVGISGSERSIVAYDSANSDPDGRGIALQVTRQWGRQ